jgi:CRP-like cAMP-binding protein
MNAKLNNTLQYLKFLSELPLFNDIPDQIIESLLSLIKVRNYQRGEILSIKVDKRSRLYITLDGQFKLTKVNERGDEMIIRLIGNGEIISPMHFSNYYEVSAEFIKDTALLYLSEDSVNQLVKDNSSFAKNIINMLAENIQSLMMAAEVWRLKNTKERLGWFLASANTNNLGKLPISKSLLASYLGMTAESLSRALKKLGDEGIKIEHKMIKQETGKELCSYCDRVIGVNCNLFGSKNCPLF